VSWEWRLEATELKNGSQNPTTMQALDKNEEGEK